MKKTPDRLDETDPASSRADYFSGLKIT